MTNKTRFSNCFKEVEHTKTGVHKLKKKRKNVYDFFFNNRVTKLKKMNSWILRASTIHLAYFSWIMMCLVICIVCVGASVCKLKSIFNIRRHLIDGMISIFKKILRNIWVKWKSTSLISHLVTTYWHWANQSKCCSLLSRRRTINNINIVWLFMIIMLLSKSWKPIE